MEVEYKINKIEMTNLEYPENELWYILVRDLEITGYGSLQPSQVLSTTADIDVFESEIEWEVILTENDIKLDELE